jgi:L-threonylcarbamoyladenylate synthase
VDSVRQLADRRNDGQKQTTKSPGMKYRHYAPRAPLILTNNILEYLKIHPQEKAGILTTQENLEKFTNMPNVISIGSRKNLKECSHNLFACLRKFDKMDVSLIICETFPKKGLGAAIMERLEKATGSNR